MLSTAGALSENLEFWTNTSPTRKTSDPERVSIPALLMQTLDVPPHPSLIQEPGGPVKLSIAATFTVTPGSPLQPYSSAA